VRDANVGQFAKTRADTVNDCVTRYDIFDDFTRSKDAGACRRGYFRGRISERHRGDLGQGQRLAVQFHRGKLNVERAISNVQRPM
jgi:hypothetical protein